MDWCSLCGNLLPGVTDSMQLFKIPGKTSSISTEINSCYNRLKGIYISGPKITILFLPLSLQNTRFLTFGHNITHPPIYHHSVLLAGFFVVKTKYVKFAVHFMDLKLEALKILENQL